MSAMSNERLEPGLIVAGRFRIEGLIGEGGMGTIYKARHVKLPRTFALKLLKPALAADADFVARFLREAVAASQVIHPGVVNVTDYGQLEDGTYYIAMEYLAGEGIDKILEREERLPLDRTLDILIQLCDALDYCHSLGIVHRDLKTDNILLCTIHGRRDVVKLVDFGIARMIGPELSQWQITQGGVIFGTPEYLSPERALDADIDGRSDIYSLGVIAFELVTGSPPFTGKYTQILKAHLTAAPPTPSSRLAEPLPPAYDALVLKCLAKKPEDRFGTCGELLGELLRVRGALAGGAHDQGSSSASGLTTRRPTTDGAWHSLAVRRPAPSSASATPKGRSEAMQLQALGDAVHLATEAAALRTALRNILKELAYELGDQTTTASGLSEPLEQVLGLERLSRSLSEELTLLAQQELQLRAETDEYTAALRQLSLDLDAVAARDDPASGAYGNQRQAVTHHMDSLSEGRDRRSATVSKEIRDKTIAVTDHETNLAQIYFMLYAGVMAVRGTEAATPLECQYRRLEELQTRLSATWSNIA
jgi:serine/threonine protein kinase